MKNMISQNLMFLRNTHHFTLEYVADKIGVSRQAVAKWESGETMPDLINSIALAKLYGVTIDDLVHHDHNKKGYAVPPIGKHIFGNVTIGERGQIVIPKKARDIFDSPLLSFMGTSQHRCTYIHASITLIHIKKNIN